MAHDEHQEPQSRRGALLALLAVVVIVAAVLLVMNRLHRSAALEDCLASGRTNCAPIETPSRTR